MDVVRPYYQPPVQSSFCTLVVNFEVSALTRRVCAAVYSFFTLLANCLTEVLYAICGAPGQTGYDNAVAAIPLDQRADVLAKSRSFFNLGMSGYDKSFILKAIGDIPEGDRADVIAKTSALFIEGMSGLDKSEIIGSIGAIPEGGRADVIAKASALFTEDMSGFDKSDIIRAIGAIPDGDRADVIAKAPVLFTEDMSGFDKSDIIRVIGAIPDGDRADVIAKASALFTEGMSGYNKSSIIRAIGSIPEGDRADVIAKAPALFTEGMSGAGKASIIGAIGDIPEGDRADVLAKAPALFTEGTSAFHKSCIIRAIRNIPEGDREDVIAKAPALFVEGTPGYDISDIIRAIGAIPEGDRADVIAKAPALFTEGMSGYDKSYIIRAIRNIPEGDRADVIAKAPALFTEGMHVDDTIDIIRAIRAIPEGDRAAYIRDRLVDIRRNQVQAIAGGINVHEGDRDQRTKAALLLLREHQGNINESDMTKAVENFKTYLEGLEDNDKKRLAQDALLRPKRERVGEEEGEPFGPLLDGIPFGVLGEMTTGHEMISRLWIYASKLTTESDIAKGGMVTALADSFESTTRVCNQGKSQRLLIAVLQGRLANVRIDPNPEAAQSVIPAMNNFFSTNAHREIENLAILLAAATLYLKQNIVDNKPVFIGEMREYARLGEIKQSLNPTELITATNTFCAANPHINRRVFHALVHVYAAD